MRHWFLSYNSQDLALMEALEAALARKDLGARIFFAPKSLRAGGYWLPALAAAIAESTAFVLLVGPNGLGPWQLIEYYEALDRRVKDPAYPVILLLTADRAAPGLPFLRQLHWIVTPALASEETVGRLLEAASGTRSGQRELWRHTAPYRGLAAMTESDSDFFFGRDQKIVEVISILAAAPDHLAILFGNSGVGKSSLAQAGVLASLARQQWPDHANDAVPWPKAFRESRHWCFLKLRPGAEPLKALIEPFLRTWRLEATDPLWGIRQAEWIGALSDGKLSLRDLIDATERRYAELRQPAPAAFFLYIDQGEELYVRADERQRRRFSALIGESIADPRLRAIMSLRSDFLGALQNDEALFNVHRKLDVPPLRAAELSEVVSRPAQILSARFETDHLANDIAQRAAADSTKDTGALPLLSYLLDDMWTKMVQRGDGTLLLPPGAIELGRVLVERADAFLADHPDSEDQVRRIFTLKLATVREDGVPTRRRALRSEFCANEWRLVGELADHPNRLLVTATPEDSETYTEVAHEAIFSCWDKLREWIAAEREFLAWRNGLEVGERTWQAAPKGVRNDALLAGHGLAQAARWLAQRPGDLSRAQRDFVNRSIKQRRLRQLRAVAAVLGVAAIAAVAVVGWQGRDYLQLRFDLWRHVLSANAERSVQPRQEFQECSLCPAMITLPPGEFMMGSPEDESGRDRNETPRHKVTLAAPFAVAKFAVTFAQWDACVAFGGCTTRPSDEGWGRGNRPVINVTWDDAQQYATWLSKIMGRSYRLLSEAEREYAARAGRTQAYPWGNDVGEGHANCDGCGSRWDRKQTAPVGSFAANAFGLSDMSGNVWEWGADCYVGDYATARSDGSAMTRDNCFTRVLRGGSWSYFPKYLRSASRGAANPSSRSSSIGFRVARTLLSP
jgi:formylglycine-generating enzyme required for sulfatase activity